MCDVCLISLARILDEKCRHDGCASFERRIGKRETAFSDYVIS